MRILICCFILTAVFISCSNKQHTYTTSNGQNDGTSGVVVGFQNAKPVTPTGGSPVVNFQPDATVFRMSGNYSDHVAVTVDQDGNLTYFPAPSDITADSRPISLGDGWWLNCQGFGPNSVFTKYTFAKYAELPETPSPEELKREIIPGAKVTEYRVLPIKQSEALSNPEAVKAYLNR